MSETDSLKGASKAKTTAMIAAVIGLTIALGVITYNNLKG